MLKKEQSNLFILGATCVFFTLSLLSVFLYSTDKLILDVSGITQSAYTSKPEMYAPIDNNAHFKIVDGHTNIQHTSKRSAEHHAKSAPIISYDVGHKAHPFFSDVKEAATLIPKVAAVSPLFTVGKLGNAFLLMAAHSVK